MADVSKTTIKTLNGLIETCKDGENGFREAAEGVKDAELRRTFTELSQQRAGFAAELQVEVRRLGGDPETSGSTAAAIHRGWMDLKSALTSDDAQAILNECERGEDSAKKMYEEAAEEEEIAEQALQVILRQQTDILQAHDRIKALRDRYAAKV